MHRRGHIADVPGFDWRKGGPHVTSPLDPDWQPAGPDVTAPIAEERFVAMPAVPAADVSPFVAMPANATDAPPAPFAAAPAPVIPAPAAPVPVPAPAPYAAASLVPVQIDADQVEALARSAPAPEQQPQSEAAYGRATTEDDSDVEVGLLTDLLVEMVDGGASDLHITAAARPTLRINGSLRPLEHRPMLTPLLIQRMLYAVLTQKQREKFEEDLELDFAYALPGKARFRVNIYRQRDSLGAAFRLIPYEIKPLEALGIPPSVANFAMLARGFVLVTGPTGSGKSTTLASLVDLANRQREDHIMTVEDPIEFLHSHKSCLINQREVGEDTWSFANALKHVLRQDPDIILVGEMRDLETISVALTAAETGHLVFATLHTQDAAQTIDRVIDVFPPHQQQQVRVQLASALQGVVCQSLCKSPDGQGRVAATEVLVATPAIRNLIREGKTHQIYSSLQAGARHGMHTMDQHLAELVKTGRITYDTGLEKCHHVEDFTRLTGRA
jgi:twitching motility protein PilT